MHIVSCLFNIAISNVTSSEEMPGVSMRIQPITDLLEHRNTIKALGRANASTLGYLPNGAFDYYFSQGTALVALNENEECVGYILWRVSRRQALIVHLCVKANLRSEGVA